MENKKNELPFWAQAGIWLVIGFIGFSIFENNTEKRGKSNTSVQVDKGRAGADSDSIHTNNTNTGDPFKHDFDECVSLYRSGKYKETLKKLDELEQTIFFEDYPNFFILKGWTLSRLGKQDEAIAMYDKFLEGNHKYTPTFLLIEGYSSKGEGLIRLGKYTDAIETFNTAIGIDDKDVGLHAGKGTALYMSQKYEDAFLESEILLKIDPNNKIGKSLQLRALKEIAKINPEWVKKQLGEN